MKVLRILFISALIIPQLCSAQLGIDVHGNYGYSLDNQFDDVRYNSLVYNFGMARRFILMHPIELNGSSESNNASISSLNSGTQHINLGTSMYGNKVALGYNSWDGTKVSGSGNIRISTNSTLNLNGCVYGDNRVNTLETKQLKSELSGMNAQVDFYFNKNKTSFSTHLLAKKDDRDYVLNDSLGSLKTNEQLLVWNTTFSYKPSINSSIKAYTGISLYKGDFAGSFVQYNGSQNVLNGGVEVGITRPKWQMQNNANFQALAVIQPNTTHQNRLELSNVFQPTIEKSKTKLSVRNSIILSSANQFYYTPSVTVHHTWDALKVYVNGSRAVHTQTNTLERTPYFVANNTGIQNLTIDRFDVAPSLKLPKYYTIKGLAAYSRFNKFIISNNELKAIARANLTVEKRIGSYLSVSSSYNYRFLGEGDLAKLIPKHTAFLELKNTQIKSAYLGDMLGKTLYWGFDLVGGYRSKQSSLANVIVSDAVQSQYFVDFSYRITNDYYYSRLPFTFTFSVRNLLAQNSLINEEQSNAALLFSEGMRTARSFTIGLEYKFKNNRY